MKQVEIFKENDENKLRDVINEWLKKNKDIKIIDTKMSDEHPLTVLITYESSEQIKRSAQEINKKQEIDNWRKSIADELVKIKSSIKEKE